LARGKSHRRRLRQQLSGVNPTRQHNKQKDPGAFKLKLIALPK
jgi:hypothetical protein